MQGRVRSWQLWPESSTLLASMAHNRWCACVGRAHKSNSIFYCCDLEVGRCKHQPAGTCSGAPAGCRALACGVAPCAAAAAAALAVLPAWEPVTLRIVLVLVLRCPGAPCLTWRCVQAGSYTQRCFDPDCSHFRSEPEALPAALRGQLAGRCASRAAGEQARPSFEEDLCDEQCASLLMAHDGGSPGALPACL